MAAGSGNFILNLLLKGSKQYLWGMIRALQLIILSSLTNVNLPSTSSLFFDQAIQFATTDIFDGNQIYENYLNLSETEPFNDKFESSGIDSKSFLPNSGSFFIFMILLVVTPIFEFIVNLICTKLAKYKIFRQIGIMVDKKHRLRFFRQSMLKLFLESYFEITIACFLGII